MNRSEQIIIRGLNICLEDRVLENSSLLIEQGKIKQIGSVVADVNAETLEFPDNYHLLPGMIDLHIHGAAGADTMDATPIALQKISNAICKEGVTSFLATTITESSASIENALQNAANFIGEQAIGAELLGINLEGPFLSPKKAGAQQSQFMRLPNIELFAKWQKIAQDLIKMVTVAPELIGAIDFIKYLSAHGVIVALGHSDATYEQANAGFAAGAREVTHLFNAMHSIHHRDPGIAVSALLHSAVKLEVIADGFHLHPAMLDLVYRAAGSERMLLITDAMRAKGLVDGSYELGGQKVVVKEGSAQLLSGAYAGSVLGLDQAVRNMMQYTNCSWLDIMKMTAINPARQLNIFADKGSIAVGKDADLVVWDDAFQVRKVIVCGKIV